jgi:hypothetical protein
VKFSPEHRKKMSEARLRFFQTEAGKKDLERMRAMSDGKPRKRTCLECGKQLVGHGKPLRCRACARKLVWSTLDKDGWKASIKAAHDRPGMKDKYRGAIKAAMQRPEVQEKISGSNHPLWQGGYSKSYKDYGPVFNNELRTMIRERDGYLCQHLKCYEPEGPVRHHVHHIDYIKSNNDQFNLITLCPSHHAAVNWNREYWKEYFQALQKMRGIQRKEN